MVRRGWRAFWADTNLDTRIIAPTLVVCSTPLALTGQWAAVPAWWVVAVVLVLTDRRRHRYARAAWYGGRHAMYEALDRSSQPRRDGTRPLDQEAFVCRLRTQDMEMEEALRH